MCYTSLLYYIGNSSKCKGLYTYIVVYGIYSALHYVLQVEGKDMNAHVTVIETSTGKKLTGEEAPTRKELEKWLSDHPG